MLYTYAALGHSHTILAVKSSEGDDDEVFQRVLDNYKAERSVALISEFNRKLISGWGRSNCNSFFKLSLTITLNVQTQAKHFVGNMMCQRMRVCS